VGIALFGGFAAERVCVCVPGRRYVIVGVYLAAMMGSRCEGRASECISLSAGAYNRIIEESARATALERKKVPQVGFF